MLTFITQGPAPALPNPCSTPLVGSLVCGAGKALGAVVSGAQTVANFASDPFGYVAQKLQDGAKGLADTVLPALSKVTRPDLTQDFFLSTYKISFALAIFVFVIFTGYNFVLLGQRRVSTDDVVETFAFYTPLFFGGVIFGPAAGTGLLAFTGSISDALMRDGLLSSADTTTKALQATIAGGNATTITGGSVIAILFFACMILALVLVFLVLLVMLVTLYLTGAILPLSLVWLVHPRQRAKGLKVVFTWVGLCFSHVLLFLMLGLAFKMVAGLTATFDSPGLQVLANLAVAIIVLVLATCSPLLLLKFAPVGPSASQASGPSLPMPGRSFGAYPVSAGDSQLAQMSRENTTTVSQPAPAPINGRHGANGSSGGGGSGGSSSGGLMGRLSAARAGAGGTGGSGLSAGGPHPGVGAGAPAGAGAPGAPGQAAPRFNPVTAGAGTGAGGVTSAAAKSKMAGAAGAAAGPAGVALAVGTAARSATAATAVMVQRAGEVAGENMDHGEGHDSVGGGRRESW